MPFKTPDLLDSNEEQIRRGNLRVVAPMFQRYGARSSFSGQIVTLKLFEDNSLVREAFAEAGTGKVLVIDGGGSLRCALVALNTHPLKSIKKGAGDRNIDISFGGISFRQDEWIYVDEDGIVVSTQALD